MSLAVDRLAAVKMATKKVEGVIYLFLLFLYPTEQSSNAAAEEDKAPIKGFQAVWTERNHPEGRGRCRCLAPRSLHRQYFLMDAEGFVMLNPEAVLKKAVHPDWWHLAGQHKERVFLNEKKVVIKV